MCLLGYEYHILDNAFLVHKPGIKSLDINVIINDLVMNQKLFIFTKILKEYKIYNGDRKECEVM